MICVGLHVVSSFCRVADIDTVRFRQAAELKDKDAQYQLSRCYGNGEGVMKDLKEEVRALDET